MKSLFAGLFCFSVLIAGCSQEEAKNHSDIDSVKVSARESSQSRTRFAEAEMLNSKKKKIAKVVLQEVIGGVRLLFAADRLTQKRYRFTIEENCREMKRSNASNGFKKTIKEMNVNRSFFQDEIKLKGYSLEDESPQSLDGKVVKLYEVGEKSLGKKPIACGRIVVR